MPVLRVVAVYKNLEAVKSLTVSTVFGVFLFVMLILANTINIGSFYPRDAMLARVFATATCPSVCLSGHLSVTRRYCA